MELYCPRLPKVITLTQALPEQWLLLASYRDFSGEAWPCFWFLKCASCWRDCWR